MGGFFAIFETMKILKWMGIIAGGLASATTILTAVAYVLIEFTPQGEKLMELFDRVEALEAKHNGKFSIGLKGNDEGNKVQYRDEEGVWHEAHKVQGVWFYFEDGQWEPVYP